MEIEIFRRQRGSSGQWKCHTKPFIKLEMPRGQIVIYQKAMELMGFKHNEAVMFGFNKKEHTGYIFKEDPEDDSYYLRYNQRGYSRFTSKDLMLHMIEVFDIDEEKAAYFTIEETPDEKGRYKFTYSKK